MITAHLSVSSKSMTQQLRNLGTQAEALLRDQYLAHEISAETYASLMEDIAIVTRGRRQ